MKRFLIRWRIEQEPETVDAAEYRMDWNPGWIEFYDDQNQLRYSVRADEVLSITVREDIHAVS